jgi:hypothetical protein
MQLGVEESQVKIVFLKIDFFTLLSFYVYAFIFFPCFSLFLCKRAYLSLT